MADDAVKKQGETPIDGSQKQKRSDGLMHVKIYAPFKVYFDGDAESITATNETGEFDILPTHHNFITLLNAGEITVRNKDKKEKIKIRKGIMHVKEDDVIVFLDV